MGGLVRELWKKWSQLNLERCIEDRGVLERVNVGLEEPTSVTFYKYEFGTGISVEFKNKSDWYLWNGFLKREVWRLD